MVWHPGRKLRPKALPNGAGFKNQHASRAILEERRRRIHEMRLYRMIVANTPEAALHVGADARIIFVSDAMCTRLEYSREELLSMHIYDIDPDYPKSLWPEHWAELRVERGRTFETRHQTKRGRIIPVEVSLRFCELEGTEYVVSLVRDITDRKQAEEELQRRQMQILELSAPVLNVARGVLAVPIIGELNESRASRVLEKLLSAIVAARARYAVLDLTGVSGVGAGTASQLTAIGQAVQLLGSRCLLSGISAETAQALYAAGADTASFLAFGTLQDALAHAHAYPR